MWRSPLLAALYWQYALAWPWVLGLLVAIGLLLVWMYPPQLRATPRSWRWAMPLLRLVAMAAIAVSILRPVVSRPRNDRERGPVVVLLDDSLSMGVIDTGRPIGQWVAIASALGRLPGLSRDLDLEGVQNDCDRLSLLADDVARARAERDYARLSGGAVDAANARLGQNVHDLQLTAHDASEKAARFAHGDALQRTLAYLESIPIGMNPETWMDRIGDKARLAANEAEQDRSANDAALYRTDAQVRAACEPLRSMSRLALAETALTDPVAGLLARLGPTVPVATFGVADRATRVAASNPLAANGRSTNLTGAIHAALTSLGDIPARAVVLISDGRQVDADPLSAAQTNGVPIFTIGAAARAGLRDVSLSDVTVPSSAFIGETINIHLLVRGLGVAGQATVITLDDGGAVQSRAVKFVDDRPMPIDFKWTARTGGAVHLVFTAANLPGELSLQNNQIERWIKVFDRRCRISIAAGSDGPDLRIARRAVSQAVWAELSQVSIGSSGAIPWSPEQIAQCDVLLLSGVRSNSFSPAQWGAIVAVVREKGGSVIVLPDENGSFGDHNAAMAELLPFARAGDTGWRSWPGERGGFQIAAAPGVHVLDFGDSGDTFWRSLPPVSRFVPLAPLKNSVRSLLVESESGTPVLTESRLGRGHVFCVGTDETWRWRENNVEYPERFWRRFIRYAGGEPYQAHDGGLLLDADPISTTPDRPVHFRLRVTAGAHDPSSAKLFFQRAGKVVRERQLAMQFPRGSGVFDTKVADLPEGDYTVRADAGPALGHPQVAVHVYPSSEAEMTDLTGDDGWLRHLAESSGGQYFRLDQVGQLPAKLRDLPVDLTHPLELPLWDGPYLYGLVLGCFAAEWGLRKRFGLS
jgi:hypothetical protein